MNASQRVTPGYVPKRKVSIGEIENERMAREKQLRAAKWLVNSGSSSAFKRQASFIHVDEVQYAEGTDIDSRGKFRIHARSILR